MIEFNVREVARAMEAQSASAAAAATLHLPARDLPARKEKRALGPLAAAVALQKFAPALSHVVLAGFVRAADFLVIAGLGLLVYAIYVVPLDGFEWHYVTTILAIAATAVFAFQWADIYEVGAFRSRVEQLSRIGLSLTIVFLFVLAAAFFAKYQGMYSRVWVSTWYGGTVLLLFAGRTLLSSLVRRWTREGRLIRRTVIVGGGKARRGADRSAPRAEQIRSSICGIFDDRNDDRSPAQVAGVPKLGTVDELVEFARRTRVDLLLVSMPITAEERVLQMLKKLWVLPVDMRLAAHMSKLRFRPRAYSYIGNVPVLDVFDKPLTDWNVVIKWLFDRVVGGLLLLAAAPLMALVAIAIKLDSKGPVFFRQKRYGFNNELIEVFKFRSMYVDKTDANAAKLVTKDDRARHPRRPFHPQDLARRAAAAPQRGVQGQSVARRPAPARGPCQGAEPAL